MCPKVRINFYSCRELTNNHFLFVSLPQYLNDMKRTFPFISLLLILLIACNDGNYTVERITFTSSEATSCTRDTTATFLYKTQGKEALILQFSAGTLKNQVDSITGNIGNNYKLFYRTFDEAPSQSYFCSSPPATSPKVLSQIEAQGGTVIIVTRAVRDTVAGVTRYNHLVRIKDLLLTNDNGERLIDQNFNFGSYQTTR